MSFVYTFIIGVGTGQRWGLRTPHFLQSGGLPLTFGWVSLLRCQHCNGQ